MHGVPIETATLPAEWERRVVIVSNRNTRMKAGLCLEAHDLAASKLAAFREKDREFVRVLLAERLVNKRRLLERLRALDLSESRVDRLVRWVEVTYRELRGGESD